MYKIYIDGKIFSNPLLSDVGCVVTGFSADYGVNSIDTLTFSVPPTHPRYGEIKKLKSVVQLYDDKSLIFQGRVIDSNRGFRNQLEVDCESEMGYLCDSIFRPFGFSGSIMEFLQALIDNHNAQVDEEKQFALGTVTVTDSNDYIVRSSKTPATTWQTINEKLINILGGYIHIRRDDGVRYLDYLADFEEVSDQVIRFGENLLDLEEYIDATGVITCLIPYGASFGEEDAGYTEQPANGSYNGNRLTIADANGGVDYITNETAVSLYSKIWGTQTWDDVTIASNLLTKAKAYLDDNIVLNMSLTIKALDLSLVKVDVSRISCCQYVRVYSPPHSINCELLCTKLHLEDNPENTEITLGAAQKSLTERIGW